MTISIIVGIIGAIISAVIGTIWYSEKTPMGRVHMRSLGVDKLSAEEKQAMIAKAMPTMWKTYLAQFVLSFMTSLFIGFVTAYTVYSGGPAEAVYYYVGMIWFAFTVPMVGQHVLWGNVDASITWKKAISDSAYNLCVFLIIAFVATLLV